LTIGFAGLGLTSDEGFSTLVSVFALFLNLLNTIGSLKSSSSIFSLASSIDLGFSDSYNFSFISDDAPKLIPFLNRLFYLANWPLIEWSFSTWSFFF
jgi:hypothetical protein